MYVIENSKGFMACITWLELLYSRKLSRGIVNAAVSYGSEVVRIFIRLHFRTEYRREHIPEDGLVSRTRHKWSGPLAVPSNASQASPPCHASSNVTEQS